MFQHHQQLPKRYFSEIQNKITNLDTTLNEEDSVDKDVVKKIKDKNNE